MVVHMFLRVLAVLKSVDKTCRPNGHLQIYLNMTNIQRFDLDLKNGHADCPQELKGISDLSKKFSHKMIVYAITFKIVIYNFL